MQLFTLRTLVCALLALGASAPSQAVVHGIVPPPPLGTSAVASASDSNRNGYRYNGPAHKYLPAASAPATEAVTTTGHWQPNPLQVPSLDQQLPYEHVYSSTPAPEEEQPQDYNGPYSMQYYKGDQHQQRLRPQQQKQQQQYDSSREQLSTNSWQQQQHDSPRQQQQQLLNNYWQQQQQLDSSRQQHLPGNAWKQQQLDSSRQQHLPGNAWKQQQLDTARQQQLHLNLDSDSDNDNEINPFQYATNHKVPAAPATVGHPVAPYGLSAGSHSARPVELDVRDHELMTQALPEPQLEQLFAAPSYEQQLGGGGSASYVQMQSHSYELPPSVSSSYSTAQREYPEAMQQHQHRQQQQQQQAAALEYATTGQPYEPSKFFHGSSSSSSSSAHSSHSPNSSYGSQSSYSPQSSTHTQFNYPSSSSSSSSHSAQSSYPSHASYPSQSYAPSSAAYNPPSREFQAPYY